MSEGRTPPLRFEGFENEWQVHNLGRLATFGKGRGYSKADLRESGTPVFLYGRVYTNPQVAVTDVDSFAEKRGGSVVSVGREVLVPSSGETAEDIATAVALLQPGVILGSDLNVVLPKSDIDPIFLALRIGNGAVKESLARRAQGKSVVHLRNSDLCSLDFSMPSFAEQRQIGALFSELDAVISHHRAKHAKLQQTKAALMQKVFPQGHADEPEMRLEGFTGRWSGTTLGKVANVSSAARVHKSQWRDHGVPFFRASDVTAIKNHKENTKAFISQELYERLASQSGRLRSGDLLVVGGGSIGVAYVVPNDEPLYSKDADLLWVKPSDLVVSRYIATYLESEAFRKYLHSISHAGAIAHFTIEQAIGTPIPLPSVPEQRAIAGLFSELDSLIAAETTYIDKLSQAKSALLLQMFPRED